MPHFEITKIELRGGWVEISGNIIVQAKSGKDVERNKEEISLAPIPIAKMIEEEKATTLGDFSLSRKGQPVSADEKEEIFTSVEKSNPLYSTLKAFRQAVSDHLKSEIDMEVRLKE